MGPLKGVKVVEFAGIGPGPFCCMLLADMGADVLRIDRAVNVGKDPQEPRFNTLLRGRKNVAIDLKSPEGVEAALKLCDQAGILIEGFRPGVMERLGLGPDVVFKRNPKIVYGRMTGWGQDGPIPPVMISIHCPHWRPHAIDPGGLAPAAQSGRDWRGVLYMAVGALAAYIEAQTSGQGQVVDTSMVEGAASLMTAAYGGLASGTFIEEREANRASIRHHTTYDSMAKHICIGSNEPQFYALMLETVGLAGADLPAQTDRDYWPMMREKLAAIFKTKTRDEWTEMMEQKDVCFAPVLRMSEALDHHHNVHRGSFIELDGVPQPGPAPRFERTPSAPPHGSAYAGEHSEKALAEWGFSGEEIAALLANGAVRQR